MKSTPPPVDIPVPETAHYPSMPATTGASFARGRSKQDYETPPELINAIKAKFGLPAFTWDLAASDENTKGLQWFTEAQGSLSQDWTKLTGNLWLNPPFGDIAPWAVKCRESSAHGNMLRRLFLLVPAAVGSNWYARHVHDHARVLFLNPRVSFDGKAPFPKDVLLALYGEAPGCEVWRWKP